MCPTTTEQCDRCGDVSHSAELHLALDEFAAHRDADIETNRTWLAVRDVWARANSYVDFAEALHDASLNGWAIPDFDENGAIDA